MKKRSGSMKITRRQMLAATGKTVAVAAVGAPVFQSAVLSDALAEVTPNASAGVDRITILPGKTYLRGWAGYGDPPRSGQPRPRPGTPVTPPPTGPAITSMWTKDSGPGEVQFADAKSLTTTAAFTTPGTYTLRLAVDNGDAKSSSTVRVLVDTAPPPKQLTAVYPRSFKINSPLWNARAKALMVSWIPHCIDQINRTDLKQGPGGIDNFVEAGKALRGEPHGAHKGYVFSNAWVHQTVEAMSIALMIDPQGDPDILKAHAKMHATLEDWIPKILAAQEPDGYLQTAFTLPRVDDKGNITPGPFAHWERRGDHEGYTGGYVLESAINHYQMTDKKDARLYNAAKKLADCWYANLGPAPKKPWYDGHQEMEQALVRFGRFVNGVEGQGNGDRYIQLAKFLLDCRSVAARNDRERSEYDQSHVPVIEQYEVVGHAVRAMYNASGMADVAVETHDPDYISAVKSQWDNLVNRKFYVTGGVGSGETSEGFGPDYSLRNQSYCESCSSCGAIFFQWKMNLAYHDSKYADLYEQTMYNALLGGTDLAGENFYYTNPLDANAARAQWHTCPCCVGNIPRTLLMMPTWAYATSPDGIYVNLFVGSTITLQNVAGTDVEMVQETEYPWKGKVAMTVNPKVAKSFSVRIRMPNRDVSALYRSSPEANGIGAITVNGTAVKAAVENGYAVITRSWKPADRIDFTLPMKIQRVRAIDKIEAARNKVALRYGPLMYNIERVDQDITKMLDPNAPLTTEWRGDLLGGAIVIRGKFTDGSPMMAIPNYARTNRDKELQPEGAQGVGQDGAVRPAQRQATSVVWMRET